MRINIIYLKTIIYSGGQTLESSDQDEKRAVLRINASKENSGAYVCVADNGIAPANYTTSYLLIKSKPQIQRNQGHDRAAGPIKGRARLRCVANAVPVVAFYWNYETGTEIRHNSSKFQVTERQLDQTTFESVLYVNDLNEADYARRIRCRATNALGSDYDFISIGPLSVPDVPDQISLLKYNSSSALVSWLPGFDGGSDQMFEIRYQSKDDKEPLTVNVSTTVIYQRKMISIINFFSGSTTQRFETSSSLLRSSARNQFSWTFLGFVSSRNCYSNSSRKWNRIYEQH